LEIYSGARLDFYSVDDNQSDFDDDEFGVSGSLGTVYNLCGCEEGSANAQSLYLNLASGFRALTSVNAFKMES
jgi:hypothetical protein